jgi:quinoprotein glucose dehydrogenase
MQTVTTAPAHQVHARSTTIGRPPRVFPVLLLAIGAVLFAGGVQLALLGGSLYYVICGAAVIASAILLWRGRKSGAHLYFLVLIGTWIWAFWEAGFDGWSLMPRVAGPTLLGLWLLSPFVRRRLR